MHPFGRSRNYVVFRRLPFEADQRGDGRRAVGIVHQFKSAPMNYTMTTADQNTQVRVVAVALSISIGVAWIAIALS